MTTHSSVTVDYQLIGVNFDSGIGDHSFDTWPTLAPEDLGLTMPNKNDAERGKDNARNTHAA
jgi:hypothetical protein